jgi:anti-anti-sigma factor
VEITKKSLAESVELRVDGRLDAHWADHLTRAIEEILRGGAHHLRVDMSGVSYMSSAGVRVLLRFRKQAQQLSGSFVVVQPSVAVRTVLEMAGLVVLFGEGAPRAAVPPESRQFEVEGIRFESFDLEKGAALQCRALGDPLKLQHTGYGPEDCRPIETGASTMVVGLGAFGRDYHECRGRFGELLAAGGVAACLPTDGTNHPDYLLSAGAFVPTPQILYGLACEGRFQRLLRFDADAGGAPASLGSVMRGCLDRQDGEVVGIVMVAESAGLIGAKLRKSPDAHRLRCDLPAVREWLSFSPERVHDHGVALLVGVVATSRCALDPFLRPLEAERALTAHLHAAAFPYRPLRKGQIDLRESVSALFEAETVLSVLHLLNDDRRIVGGGQSALVRGACWISPVTEIHAEEG